MVAGLVSGSIFVDRGKEMTVNLKKNFIIGGAGLGCATGAFSTVVEFHLVFFFAFGLALMLIAVFNTLWQIQEKINQPEARDKQEK